MNLHQVRTESINERNRSLPEVWPSSNLNACSNIQLSFKVIVFKLIWEIAYERKHTFLEIFDLLSQEIKQFETLFISIIEWRATVKDIFIHTDIENFDGNSVLTVNLKMCFF